MNVHWLKPTLSLLFAVTTPFGMGVGMVVWGGGKGGKGGENEGLSSFLFRGCSKFTFAMLTLR